MASDNPKSMHILVALREYMKLGGISSKEKARKHCRGRNERKAGLQHIIYTHEILE